MGDALVEVIDQKARNDVLKLEGKVEGHEERCEERQSHIMTKLENIQSGLSGMRQDVQASLSDIRLRHDSDIEGVKGSISNLYNRWWAVAMGSIGALVVASATLLVMWIEKS